jgi:hypothetical protein
VTSSLRGSLRPEALGRLLEDVALEQPQVTASMRAQYDRVQDMPELDQIPFV